MMDGKINAAVGMAANSRTWKNTTWNWSDFADKLMAPHYTTETLKEFMSAPKAERSKIKDVGGYVGGFLRGSRRKSTNVVYRQLITLDIDFAHLEFWDDFTLQFANAAVLHSTHSHSDESPRYRLIMPINREVTPDEYVAISRRIAGDLGIELFDKTTFEVHRLMFWPSSPKDTKYYCESQEGDWLDADEILAAYVEWTDSSQWPISGLEEDTVKKQVSQQQNPEEKKGMIGTFCRTYGITDAIEIFLSDAYTPAMEGRYTYVNGSTSAGLAIYEDTFAYSHHGTDPAGGKLCNVFDLVRIHKFGNLDIDSNVKTNSKLPSFKAMEDFILKDEETKKTLATEAIADSKYDFANDMEAEKVDVDWMAELEIDGRKRYLSSASNLNLIFANDLNLRGIFKHNDFDNKRYIFKSAPWRKVEKPEPVKNVDYSGVRNYIESIYNISSNMKVDDSLSLEFDRNSFHPVRDYLKALKWDGTERLDSLLVDYFGAKDNVYTREAIRKMLVGAVARVMRPGIKFDLVLVLVGEQGNGKSTFVNKLGQQWFSDTFMTVQGKEALEQIQGAWLIEMAELAGLRKAEVEAVKHFISKQEDAFRPAYARVSETFMRQCVFFGTTNKIGFLNDPSGARRFMPIDTARKGESTKSVFSEEFDNIIGQVWAEAYLLYKSGESLYLSPDAEIIAKSEQIKHQEADERQGPIVDYLDKPLPEDWADRDIYDRRDFMADKIAGGNIQRQVVCVAEIWCECLGKEKEDLDRYKSRSVNDILRGLEDWEAHASTKNFGMYGKQKYYSRKPIL